MAAPSAAAAAVEEAEAEFDSEAESDREWQGVLEIEEPIEPASETCPEELLRSGHRLDALLEVKGRQEPVSARERVLRGYALGRSDREAVNVQGDDACASQRISP